MRDLKDYSLEEWYRLLPFVHFYRLTYSRMAQSAYLMRHPGYSSRFLQDVGHLRGRNIGIVVAFEQPWALDWLLRMADRNLSDVSLLVFDNSRREKARSEIESVCRNRGVPYLALPRNQTRHANRSHGIAMTWIYYNVVKPLRPKIFGFIDHDLIPLERMELGKSLGDQPFYGLLKVGKYGWQIWAGYCWYDFSVVENLPMNFLHEFSLALDTGGRNWYCLYRKYDHTRYRFAGVRKVDLKDPAGNTAHAVSVIDDKWVHIGGISYRKSFKDELEFYGRIEKAIDEGVDLQQLIIG